MTKTNSERLLLQALQYVGTRGIPGQQHNTTVVDMLQRLQSWVRDDETPWCSAFMNFIAAKCRLETTGRLDARSWLSVGQEITVPDPGDVVIFWREDPSSWKGHVSLFLREEGGNIWALGGNQSNEVRISIYPADRVLGFRKLRSTNP